MGVKKPDPTNYRRLLVKYMAHVGDQEGTYFLGRSLDKTTKFTREEIVELNKIRLEADNVSTR